MRSPWRYAETGALDEEVASVAGSASAVSSEIVVQVTTTDGKVLYDDTWALGASHAGARHPSRPRFPPVRDATVSSPITAPSGQVVGSVRVWALGSEALLTKADSAFRTNSYGAIATAAAIAALLACVIGAVVSRAISRPIQRITSTAKEIRNGDLTARTGVTGADEVGQLGETFDDMAGTIERDLKLEHRLTGDVAHELRTPLMAMQATVEACRMGSCRRTTSIWRWWPPRCGVFLA